MTFDKCDALKSFLGDLDDLGVDIKTDMYIWSRSGNNRSWLR